MTATTKHIVCHVSPNDTCCVAMNIIITPDVRQPPAHCVFKWSADVANMVSSCLGDVILPAHTSYGCIKLHRYASAKRI